MSESTDLVLNINTVWTVVAAILVFFMQAGFALLEGGMVRSKNTVNVVMKNYMDMCFGAIFFWLIGFGLMFGNNPSGWIGVDRFAMNTAEDWDFTLLLFQTMFAATAATIVSGAIAERIRYWSYILVSIAITTFIYPIYGSWAWGSAYEGVGWLKERGFIDFAGSTVVHSIGGWCALAGVIALGPRLGRFAADGTPRVIPGHNLPLLALGGFILWFGWFGFNAGSTTTGTPNIGLIALNTHLAASAGVVGASLWMLIRNTPVLMTTTINGGLAGLVGITAGCASMEPVWAVATGLIAGMLVILATNVLEYFRIDDSVGAVPVHGVCGAWGTIAAGLFLKDNLFDFDVFLTQFLGVGAAFLWAFPTAFLIFKGLSVFSELRVDTVSEQRGLDYVEHYEVGYPEFQETSLHQGKD